MWFEKYTEPVLNLFIFNKSIRISDIFQGEQHYTGAIFPCLWESEKKYLINQIDIGHSGSKVSSKLSHIKKQTDYIYYNYEINLLSKSFSFFQTSDLLNQILSLTTQILSCRDLS